MDKYDQDAQALLDSCGSLPRAIGFAMSEYRYALRGRNAKQVEMYRTVLMILRARANGKEES